MANPNTEYFFQNPNSGTSMCLHVGKNGRPVVIVCGDAEGDATPADYLDCTEFTAAVSVEDLYAATLLLKRVFGVEF